jgi:hypothetical protein
VTAAPPARRHHQTYPDPICQSAASRRRACGAARRRQPDRPLRPPAGTTKPILTRSARAPPLVAARAARRGVANRIEVVPCWDPNGTATGSGSHRHAVADRWASLPGDLVRLVASRVLAGDLLDYAASGRLHRLAVRCRLPSRPRRRRPALPPALLDDASRGPACAPATPTFAGTSASSTSTRGPWFAPTSRTSVTTAPSILSRQTNIKIRSLADPVSASVSFSAGAITVMLALHEVHRRVAFATTMDRQWNVSSWTYQSGFPPPFSFRGKLYITCYALYSPTLEILQIDPPVREGGGVGSSYVLHPPKLMATVPEGSLIRPIYLVECDSERSCCLATKISACRRLLFSSSPILSFKGVPR